MAENLAGSAPFQPDPRFDRPEELGRTLQARVLPLVSAPASYVGGEPGTDREGFAPQRANFLLAFPDTYEIGSMASHTARTLAGPVMIKCCSIRWPSI